VPLSLRVCCAEIREWWKERNPDKEKRGRDSSSVNVNIIVAKLFN
jgi:hypothetical protein